TGCGMSQETRSRVFDPFFSTKGAGHGLGLAVVHGIVRSLGGGIGIHSEVDRGATIEVLLPCAEITAGGTFEPITDAGEAARPSQDFSIMVVEDEDYLRQGVARMLRKAGFQVLEAANGTVAIDLLRQEAGKIDVILLDLTLPGATSHEVVAE